jgi:hypothetical protein
MMDFVGDICLANGNTTILTKAQKKYKYPIDQAELIIANLECVFVEKENFDSSSFNFCCPEGRVDILKDLGVNIVSLANNHIMDGGYSGLATTIDTLKSNSISHFGAGINIEDASSPLIVNHEGKKYAFLGRMEVESFGDVSNCIASEEDAGVAPLLLDELIKTVDNLKSKRIDYIILCVHWGVQEIRRAHPRIQEKSRVLIESIGIDLIIGNHSHCMQGAKLLSNKNVFFGLGNFFFLPYQLVGNTLYDGTLKLNSESLIARVTADKGILKAQSFVVCQNTDATLLKVDNDREQYLIRKVFGNWGSNIAALFHLEYRARGILIEAKKFSLLFTSKAHRKKLFFEISRPHIFLKRVFDMIFNPRHR